MSFFLPLPPRRGGYAKCLSVTCPPLEGDSRGRNEMCPHDRIKVGRGLEARAGLHLQKHYRTIFFKLKLKLTMISKTVGRFVINAYFPIYNLSNDLDSKSNSKTVIC